MAAARPGPSGVTHGPEGAGATDGTRETTGAHTARTAPGDADGTAGDGGRKGGGRKARRGGAPGNGRRPGPWAAWRRWRKGRPFWGGLAAILAGAEICVIPLAPLKIMLQQGVAGIPSVLMGVVMIVLGLSAWFTPHYRGLAGVLTTLIATAALVLSNLGGFLIGTILGIVGGGLMFGWQPRPAAPARQSPERAPAAPDPAEPAAPAEGAALPAPPAPGAPHGRY